MRRRDFNTLLGGAASWSLAARAQQAGNVLKIGLLWPGVSAPAPPRMDAFRQGLRESGLVEGRDVVIELRYAEGGLQQLPELAAELIRLKVDVFQASGDLAPRVAQHATATIPIVAFSDDILGAGLIASLSRPGGNMTGLTILSPELSAKRLELLRELLPGRISRVAALWDPTTGTSQVTLTESAARSLNIKLQMLEVRRGDDLAGVFELAKKRASRGPQRILFSVSCFVVPRNHRSCGQASASGDFPVEGTCGGRWPRILRAQPCGAMAADRDNRGEGPPGREACRSPRGATDEIRAGHQP
jgi:putative ABC transport system substrate-binding protein